MGASVASIQRRSGPAVKVGVVERFEEEFRGTNYCCLGWDPSSRNQLTLTFTQLAFPNSFSAKAQPGCSPFHKHRSLSAAHLCTGLLAYPLQPGSLVFPAVPRTCVSRTDMCPLIPLQELIDLKMLQCKRGVNGECSCGPRIVCVPIHPGCANIAFAWVSVSPGAPCLAVSFCGSHALLSRVSRPPAMQETQV